MLLPPNKKTQHKGNKLKQQQQQKKTESEENAININNDINVLRITRP